MFSSSRSHVLTRSFDPMYMMVLWNILRSLKHCYLSDQNIGKSRRLAPKKTSFSCWHGTWSSFTNLAMVCLRFIRCYVLNIGRNRKLSLLWVCSLRGGAFLLFSFKEHMMSRPILWGTTDLKSFFPLYSSFFGSRPALSTPSMCVTIDNHGTSCSRVWEFNEHRDMVITTRKIYDLRFVLHHILLGRDIKKFHHCVWDGR